MSKFTFGLLLALCFCFSCKEEAQEEPEPIVLPPPPPLDNMASYQKARKTLQAAIKAMGNATDIRQSEGLFFKAQGILNRGTEQQGMSFGTLDPGEFEEVFAIDSTLSTIAYEHRHLRSDSTFEWLREIYKNEDEKLLLIFQEDPAFAVHLQSSNFLEERKKILRRCPVLLLSEVAQNPSGLRWLRSEDMHDLITATLSTGESLILTFNRQNSTLARLEFVSDMQNIGDTPIKWDYQSYKKVEGLGLFPYQYSVSVGGKVYTEMEVKELFLQKDTIAQWFEVPKGIHVPRITKLPIKSDPSANAKVKKLDKGVFVVENLRGGFHPIFIEMESFVVAIDAPAGYKLLNEIPAGEFAPGSSLSWLSERYYELIKETIPDKPIEFVALTHGHGDHSGGVRAFVSKEAKVLVPPSAKKIVENMVSQPHTFGQDWYNQSPKPLKLEVIADKRIIQDPSQTFVLINIGKNPHSEDMLVVYFPEKKMMFVSDVFTPSNLRNYPSPSHGVLDKWFAGWLADSGLEVEKIYSMHSSEPGTKRHLEKLVKD